MARSDILRFATAGSVDDGKSSLIGRLLYDSKAILEDQMLSIERASTQRGSGQLELALLTDGLRAEREQNITIDVAYRYFATAKRKFIIADTPGHVQYTRNMATGASTAELSVILIDATKGVLSQSKRHAAISALLGIRHLVVAVNKMDLVGYQESAFCEIVRAFGAFARKLEPVEVTFIPISALVGDNVVDAGSNMPWYGGPALLEFLENVDVSGAADDRLRLPVQTVIRPDQSYRGFAGRLESGTLRVGDTIEVASSRMRAEVRSMMVSGEPAQRAEAGQAVAVALDREIDISRGDLLYSPCEPPLREDSLEAVVCWMHESPLEVGRRYILLHGPRRVSVIVEKIVSLVDVDSYETVPAHRVGLNDLAHVILRTANPLWFDRYSEIAGTGSCVLVDAGTHATVACGMLAGPADVGQVDYAPRGKAIHLRGFGADAAEVAGALRRVGEQVILISASDGVSAQEIEAWVPRLTTQGVNVLIEGLEPSEPADLELHRNRYVQASDAAEEILPHLEHALRATPPVTGNL